MDNNISSNHKLSEFLKYLAFEVTTSQDRVPPLYDLSKKLGVSVASLREQLEVARALGVVEVRPKTGIKRLAYTFAPAIKQSLNYAMALDPNYFNSYSELRRNIETSFWYQAVCLLKEEDQVYLFEVVKKAKAKLKEAPAQIPNQEHRRFHLKIFDQLNNPFVTGILETYWDLYEIRGKDTYLDINYQNKVWDYHQKIAESVFSGDYATGYKALVDHMDLYYQQYNPKTRQKFE